MTRTTGHPAAMADGSALGSTIAASRPAIGHWFRPLLFNWRFAASWLIFATFAFLAAWILIETNHPPAYGDTVTRASQRDVGVSSPSLPVEWSMRSGGDISKAAMLWGYIGWSLWWGMPWCLATVGKIAVRLMNGWLSLFLGIPLVVITLLAFSFAGIFYSILGGGAFHFFRRWWDICRPRPAASGDASQPAVAWPPPALPTSDVPARFARLEVLKQQRLITTEEYTRRREAIIDEATR